MKRKIILSLGMMCWALWSFGQYKVSGKLISDAANVPNVSVVLGGSSIVATTNEQGVFSLEDVPAGNYTVIISSASYDAYSQALTVSADTDLGTISLVNSTEMVLDLGEVDLDNDDGSASGASSFLQASKDPFMEAAAYQWGSFFFKQRGADSDKSQVMFNGIVMNKAQNNRPLFRDWGGLNDITRYPAETKYGLDPSVQSFGSLSGVMEYSTRASDFAKGGRISAALTNASYTQRLAGLYSSGMQTNGWAWTVAGVRRWAEEGIQDGTKFDSWSYFLAVERKLNDKHSLNFSAFGSPYKKGGASPNTQEAYDLNGGVHYNAYWGWQEGKRRNERVRNTFQPIFMLTDYWKISDNAKLETTLSYQFGKNSYTRLEEGEGIFASATETTPSQYVNSPSPVYYKYLPSYYNETPYDIHYNNDNIQAAPVYKGQINWYYLYQENRNNAALGKGAAYYLAEDVNKDKVFNAATHLQMRLGDHTSLNSNLSYQYTYSDNYRTINDLLGGLPIANRDFFNKLDYNLLDDNNLVNENDKFNYSYNINQYKANAYSVVNMSYDIIDFYLAASATYTSFWRRGDYQYEIIPYDSYGVSKKEDFLDFGVKTGITFKASKSNFFSLSGMYQTNAPTTDKAYPNKQYANTTADDLKSNKIYATEASYIHNGKVFRMKLTGYYTQIQDDIQSEAFYDTAAEEATNDPSATTSGVFLYTSLSNVETQYFGGEFGAEYKLTPSWKIHGAAALGQYTYISNPGLQTIYTSGTDYTVTPPAESTQLHFKDYKVSGSPQMATNLGIDYNSPNHWWCGLDWNVIGNNYVDITSLKHSDLFTSGEIGTQEQVDKLLEQERFSTEYFLNFNAGKSWRIGQNNMVATLSVTNILDNKNIKTGGFEQGRTSTFSEANKEYEKEQNGQTPAYGNKYWYNQGMSFFFNITYKFH